MLEEVSRAHLKPHQGVEILRSHLIPRLIHLLTLGVVHQKTLNNVDSKVTAALRKLIRLPADTSKALFHSGIDAGCLGILHLLSHIPLDRKARLGRHFPTTNGLLHWFSREPPSQPFFLLALRTRTIGGDIITNRQEAAAAWCKSLWNTLDGTGLCNLPTVSQAHNWLRHPVY
ncbi:hypothetical protein PHET_11369 [Paragonimus heterotremus]|uniref:Uncharacterized protein n=1 Tax=Paragonimus heterotremus TaxID=100268 RepID=A0A8J4T0Y4_9TREM|nr:hypothetical protein PHET_11369 [Paragonimus heterotremus]